MSSHRFSMPLMRATSLVVAAAVVGFAVPALAAPPSGNYKLLMADEFDEPTLDLYKWNYHYPWGRQHNHQGYMTEDNVVINNGVLDLQAKTGRHPNATDFWRDDFGWQQVNYTTGAINTNGKFNITRGYLEARVKLYGSIGSWPAMWMLTNGWPPEIDILEFPRGNGGGLSNNNNTAMFNYHYTNGSSNASYYKRDTGLPDLTAGYNTFALEWTSSVMNFYVNGSLRHQITDSGAIADAVNMYLILNQGVGGWAGNVTGNFESHYWVDSVKIWQIPGASDHTWKPTSGSASWDTASNWSTNLVPRFEDTIARFLANNNSEVNINWSHSNAIGGLHFDTQTTAYTVGTSSGSLQFAKAASGANGTIFMTQATSLPQTVGSRIELYDGVTVTNNSAETLTLSGKIIGNNGIQKAGPGVLVLSGDSTFKGGVYTTGASNAGDLGVVRLRHNNAAGVGTVNLPSTNASSSVIELEGGITVSNNLTTAGRSGLPTFLRNYRGDNTWAGNITINNTGGLYAIDAAHGSLTLSGNVSTTVSSASDRVFNLIGGATGNGQITGVISDGATTKVGIGKAGVGTWTLANTNAYSAGTTVDEGTLIASAAGALGTGAVTVNGGTLAIENAFAIGKTNALTVNGGTVQLKSGIGTAVLLSTPIINGEGKIDLRDTGLILDHESANAEATLALVQSQLLSSGLMSSVADADARLSIGFGSSAALSLTSFGGVDVDADAIVLRVTLRGDTNLDSVVDFDDLLTLAQNYGRPVEQTWTTGDFDRSGGVGFDDLLALAQNYGASYALVPDSAHADFAADWALARSLVPEPTTLLFAPASLFLLRRRRV